MTDTTEQPTEQPTDPAVAPLSPQAAALRDLAAAYAARRPVRSVAVVGNKPMTADDARADAIDGADLVVRINGFALDAPPGAPGARRGYGRRTDVVFFNRGVLASPDLFDGYRQRLYLLVEPGRLHWEPELVPGWWPRDLGQVHVSNADVTLPLSDAIGLPSRAQGLWATTGTMAAWWARSAFPEADLLLTGFSIIDDVEQTSWLHAAGDEVPVNPEHRIAAESALLGGWERAGLVRVLR